MKDYKIAKENLFSVIDEIEHLKTSLDLTAEQQIRLRNLEVLQMKYWSMWKD